MNNPFRGVPVAGMVSGDRYEVQFSRGYLQESACFGSATGMTTSAPSGDFTTFSVSTAWEN
jgi:hypothetical protein